MAKEKNSKYVSPAMTIRSKREGFRRAGIAHSEQAVDYPEGKFSEEQVDLLINEPMLVVVLAPSGT